MQASKVDHKRRCVTYAIYPSNLHVILRQNTYYAILGGEQIRSTVPREPFDPVFDFLSLSENVIK